MRIGVVSDTHNHLANVSRIVELFNEARVERVVHTGDITQPKTLRAFADLRAPLVGVFGNNDERERLRPVAAELGMDLAEGPRTLEWVTRRILVVHDPLEIEEHLDGHDIVLHGHDHRRRIEQDAGILYFNPGECAGHVPGLNTIGVLDLPSRTADLLRF